MIKVSETLVMAFLGVIIVLAWFLVILLFVFTVKVLLSSWLTGAIVQEARRQKAKMQERAEIANRY